jgi:hypothetical protein
VPDTYGVVATDISGELSNLFPAGFTSTTAPTLSQATGFISAQDAIAKLHVELAAAVAPQITDAAAPLAKRYIVEATKASAMRVLYAGQDPKSVEAAAAPFQNEAERLLGEIDKLGKLATGDDPSASRAIASDTTTNPRTPLITNDMLGSSMTTPRRRAL